MTQISYYITNFLDFGNVFNDFSQPEGEIVSSHS